LTALFIWDRTEANYTRSRKAIKATIRYITHRPGKDGEKTSRELFGYDGIVDKQQAYKMVDEAESGTIFFRIVISPDPRKEDRGKDLDLRDMTRQTILRLEERLKTQLTFLAVEHNDHTETRHIHSVVMIKGKLSAQDFNALRQSATQQALFQRKARDLVQHYPLNKSSQRSIARFSTSYRPIGMSGGKARRTRESYKRLRMPRRLCSSCGRGLSMKRLRSGQYKCFECGLKQEQSAGLSL
jgi:ribosomal protein L37AE/L43A